MDKNQNISVFHPMQSTEWGQAREAMGIEVVKVECDGELYQMTIHPIPHTAFSIGYIARSGFPSTSAIQKLKAVGKQHNLVFIKMEPYVPYDEKLKEKITSAGLTISMHPLFPEWTQTLSLIPSEEDLLKGMKPKTRYNIRLAEKKGVVIREMSNDSGYSQFEKLYFETCRRQHYRGHTPAYHRTLWNYLKESQAHILVAYLGDVPLAAYELLFFGNNLYYLYGGSTLQNKNVMAANLLMWEAIRLGKKLGAELFDMWGSLPPDYPESHPWAGFTRFKQGYGTQFQRLAPSFDIVLSPLLYRVYGVLHTVREKFL